MTTTTNKLPGTAGRIAELYGNNIALHSMYDQVGSGFYHSFMAFDTAEVDEIVTAAASRKGGSLLELACGSGRITLPLLDDGWTDVTGLDLSPAMLDLLNERLAGRRADGKPAEVKTVHGDMTDFDLGRTFDVIVLAATAVWNIDADGRAKLFDCVRRHLNPNGVFLFTALAIPGFEEAPAPFEYTSVFVTQDDTSPVLCTFIDHVDPSGLRCTSVLCNRISDGSVSDAAIYSAWTHLVPLPELENKELPAAGLTALNSAEVVNKHQITRASRSSARQRVLYEAGLANAW